jgi:hypothetical protein
MVEVEIFLLFFKIAVKIDFLKMFFNWKSIKIIFILFYF